MPITLKETTSIKLDKESKERAKVIFKELGITMGDALIAATAIVHNELLCTSNIKHFSPITNVKLDHYSPIE